MNFICYFRMCFIRLLRDPTGLILSIATPPFFTLFFWVVYHNATTKAIFATVNDDRVVESFGESQSYGNRLLTILSEVSKLSKSIDLQLVYVNTKKDAEDLMRNGAVDGMIYIPSGFSGNCLQQSDATWYYSFQKANPILKDVAFLLYRCNVEFNSILSQKVQPVAVEMIDADDSNKVSPFIAFIPGMLTFAVIMIMFSVSGVVSREIESGAFIRLRMSVLSPFEMVMALGSVHFLVAIVSVLLTLLTIKLTGFSFPGNFAAIMLLCSLSVVSTIAIGFCIASIARSRHKTLLASCIVMFVFVLFSGIIFPIPQTEILKIGQNPMSLFDFLPTVQLHSGLMGILFRNAGLADISYECCVLIILSVALSIAGGLSMRYFVYKNHRKIKA